jgi:hypothetical protein
LNNSGNCDKMITIGEEWILGRKRKWKQKSKEYIVV